MNPRPPLGRPLLDSLTWGDGTSFLHINGILNSLCNLYHKRTFSFFPFRCALPFMVTISVRRAAVVVVAVLVSETVEFVG